MRKDRIKEALLYDAKFQVAARLVYGAILTALGIIGMLYMIIRR